MPACRPACSPACTPTRPPTTWPQAPKPSRNPPPKPRPPRPPVRCPPPRSSTRRRADRPDRRFRHHRGRLRPDRRRRSGRRGAGQHPAPAERADIGALLSGPPPGAPEAPWLAGWASLCCVASAEHAHHRYRGAGRKRPRDPGGFAALTDAALVIADGTVAWTGLPPGRPRRNRCGRERPGPAAGLADSHAHLVFAGDRSASSPPDGGLALPGRRHSGHGRGDPAAPDVVLRHPAAAGRRDAPPGHDHVQVQVRVRADGPGQGARLGPRRRGHPRGHLPRRARRAARVRRRPGRVRPCSKFPQRKI